MKLLGLFFESIPILIVVVGISRAIRWTLVLFPVSNIVSFRGGPRISDSRISEVSAPIGGLHPNQITQWKNELLKRAAD